MEPTSWYVDAVCKTCSIPFRARRQTKWGKPRENCSYACKLKHRNADVLFECEICGKKEVVKRNTLHLDRGDKHKRFCSKKCLYVHWERNGKPDKRGGEDAEGRLHFASNGYIYERRANHPSVRDKEYKYVLQHRLVMEMKLGRLLLPGENVHHLNSDKRDNRPENLELWVVGQPNGKRQSDVVAENEALKAKLETQAMEMELAKAELAALKAPKESDHVQ